jgi:hypothetical protein
LAALCAALAALAPRFPVPGCDVRYAVATSKPDTFLAG